MDKADLRQAVLEFVKRPGYKPLKPRQIAKRLSLSKDETKEVRKVVKDLVKKGQLAYGANHLVHPPNVSKGIRLTGTFHRTEAGHGYVRPSGTSKAVGRSEDIYIPAKEARDAATGDIVLVQVGKERKGGRPGQRSGFVVEIVERETHTFVGNYFERSGNGFVQVDGTVISEPVYVGDAGAKGAKPDDKVVFEMVRFPSHVHDGEGVIVEVLGPRGQPGVETLAIIREYNLPDEFAEDALEEARRQAEQFDESLTDRLDLTAETTVTIDPPDARDFDDAISLDRLENGHWKLGVHIADVSHFVRPGSALDRAARARGTSVYLPDRVLPMLPEIVSNSLASLQPDHVRYTKTAFIEFTEDGAVAAVDLHNSAIRSKRRFTYDEVDDFLGDRESWRDKLDERIFALLERMYELAMILRRRRFHRGAIELTMRDVEIDLDNDGRVVGAHLEENTESHQIIEEFMLAANEGVADLLQRRDWGFLRRIHPQPDPQKLDNLKEFTDELGYRHPSLQSRFEIQKLLEEVHGQPEEPAVNFAVLRSMQQAVYSPEPEGHFALAAEHYTHFTSPIRRYPDLTIHRLVNDLVGGRKPPEDASDLVVLGEHCSSRERRAEQAERELIKVKLLTFFEDRIGEQLSAVITGVESFGLFVQGVDIPVEGLVHISTLEDDYYWYDRATHALIGRRKNNTLRLGDRVTVEVVHVEIERRELDFRLLQLGWRAPGKEAGKKAAKKSTSRRAAKSASSAKSGGKKSPRGGRGKAKASQTKKSGKKPKGGGKTRRRKNKRRK